MLLDLQTNVIVESRDDQFLENKFHGNSTNESIFNSTLNVEEKFTVPSSSRSSLLVNNYKRENVPKEVEQRRTKSTRKENVFNLDFIFFSSFSLFS